MAEHRTSASVDPNDRHAIVVRNALADAVDGKGHQPELAYALAVISGWAYADPEVFTDIMGRIGATSFDITPFNVTNEAMLVASQAYVLKSADGRLAIVAFRGTRPLQVIDWLVDGTVKPQPVTEARQDVLVHGGFLRNLEATWPRVAIPLGADAKLQALYLTGHSLGGAMAALAAARLAVRDSLAPDLGAKLRGLYTFGQPMVALETGANILQEILGDRTFRYVYGRDVAPRMPPSEVGTFRHFGQEYHSKKEGGWERDLRTERTEGLVDLAAAFMGFALGQFPALRCLHLRSIEDHFPTHYVGCAKVGAGLQSSMGRDSGGQLRFCRQHGTELSASAGWLAPPGSGPPSGNGAGARNRPPSPVSSGAR